MDYLNWLQWPAMVATVVAAWLIGSLRTYRRIVGFLCFLLSNALWVIWGWHTSAWALIILQFCLAVLNLRGLLKNEQASSPHDKPL